MTTRILVLFAVAVLHSTNVTKCRAQESSPIKVFRDAALQAEVAYANIECQGTSELLTYP